MTGREGKGGGGEGREGKVSIGVGRCSNLGGGIFLNNKNVISLRNNAYM